jgi:hypothetical protein
MSITNYQSVLCNIPEEQIPHFHHSRSLISHTVQYLMVHQNKPYCNAARVCVCVRACVCVHVQVCMHAYSLYFARLFNLHYVLNKR